MTDNEVHAFTSARLLSLMDSWHATGKEPAGAGVLSAGEYVALAIAAGHETSLGRSPVINFLLLDGWLQRWVLETRGLHGLVGTKVGYDPARAA